MLKLLIFLLFLPLAQAKNFISMQISSTLKDGRFLIYDCEKKFFACVDQFSFEICEEDRKSAISKRQDFMPCAPLKRFSDYDECAKEQVEKTRHPIKKRFCWYQLEKIY